MKLINANKLYDAISDNFHDVCSVEDILDFIDCSDNITVTDMTCGHCKHFAPREHKNENTYGVCSVIANMHSDKNYCSYFDKK